MFKKISPYFCLILIFAVILPYLAGLNGELLFDDIPLIKEDPFYLQTSNPLLCWARSFWKIEETQGLYRPLTLFSYWLDINVYSFWADSNTMLFDTGFRITNLLLHLFVVLLLYKFILRLRFDKSIAFIASLIYALHPIHVEAVTPAFGRGELLCALFMLLGLIFHTYKKQNKLYVLLAGISYMLSFMSKENGVIFLPIIILMDLYLNHFFKSIKVQFLRIKKYFKTAIKATSGVHIQPTPSIGVSTGQSTSASAPTPTWFTEYVPSGCRYYRKGSYLFPYSIYTVALIAVFCCRYFALGTWLPAKQYFQPIVDNTIALSTPLLRIVAAIRIQGLALVKFFWPATLSYDYSYSEILPSESILDPFAWLTLILFITIPALYIYLYPKDKNKIIFLVMVYIITIIPAGNFIIPAGTIFAERLQYVPSMFLSIFSALIIMRISHIIPYKVSVIFLLSISLILCVRTFKRTFVWYNPMTLAVSGAISAPKSLKVWNNLSVQLCAINDYKGAILVISKAIEIYPQYATGYINRGTFYFRMKNYKKAKEDIRRGLKLSLNHKYGNYILALIYMDEGYLRKAQLVIERILKYYPKDKKLLEIQKVISSKIKKRFTKNRH